MRPLEIPIDRARGARPVVAEAVVVEALEDRRLLAAADGSFSIVVLPDTQVYADRYPEILNSQLQWIRDNAATKHIAFVTGVGDVVDQANDPVELQRADAAFDRLDGVVPYAVPIGNHDYDTFNDRSSATKFVQYFGSSRYAGKSWYGGASANQLNHYQIFQAGPWRFLHVALQWEAPDADLAWAQGVINANPGLPVMVSTHQYLTGSATRTTGITYPGGNSGEAMWQELIKRNPRIFMVNSGHYTAEARLVSQNDAGQDVHQIVVDHQGRTMGGEGFLRVLRFVPDEDRVEVTSYSPYLNRYETDANSQFNLTIDFATRFPPSQGQGTTVRVAEVLVPVGTKQSTPFSTKRVEQPWEGRERTPEQRPTVVAKPDVRPALKRAMAR